MVWPSCITCTVSSFVPSGPLTRRKFCFETRWKTGVSCEPPQHRLKASYVLRLKPLRTFLHFKFHRLTFIEGLVAFHSDCGEMNENIFSGLALDESIALRSIEPLYCALFLHLAFLSYVTPVEPGQHGIALL